MVTHTESRLDYAHAHSDQYLDWIDNVARGPSTPLDRLEFAIISAHTPMRPAIEGWFATRESETISQVAQALDANGVMAPRVKAGYISEARHRLNEGEVPWPSMDYQEWRRTNKIAGLGWCKASFACCLIDPFKANVLCLDTHMVQAVYDGDARKECARLYRNLAQYEATEAMLLAEADEVGLPPFAYQWAVWDYQRWQRHRKPPETHSFLWSMDNARHQLPLFSSLED